MIYSGSERVGAELLRPCEEIGSNCLQGTTSTSPESANMEPPSLQAHPQLQETKAEARERLFNG